MTIARFPRILSTANTYRPEFFGRHFGRALHAAIRGESHFTAGERELMAATTSHLNECLF